MLNESKEQGFRKAGDSEDSCAGCSLHEETQ